MLQKTRLLDKRFLGYDRMVVQAVDNEFEIIGVACIQLEGLKTIWALGFCKFTVTHHRMCAQQRLSFFSLANLLEHFPIYTL